MATGQETAGGHDGSTQPHIPEPGQILPPFPDQSQEGGQEQPAPSTQE